MWDDKEMESASADSVLWLLPAPQRLCGLWGFLFLGLFFLFFFFPTELVLLTLPSLNLFKS